MSGALIFLSFGFVQKSNEDKIGKWQIVNGCCVGADWSSKWKYENASRWVVLK